MTIFGLKIMVKSGLDFFFEIERAPCRDTCEPARLIQPFWADFFALAAVTLKGIIQFQNKKNCHFKS
jgi:hypothetical protein